MARHSYIPDERLIFVDDLEVWVVVRKRNKRPVLHVKPDGRIEVSVPRRCSDREVADFVREKHDWIVRMQREYEGQPMNRAALASDEEVRAWREIVEAFVPPLMEKWEPVLGVRPSKVVYRKMTSRWGSCQPETGRICINVVLAICPIDCLEYVVVHELCHLRVPGHGPRFRALMDSVMPDWEKRRQKLR